MNESKIVITSITDLKEKIVSIHGNLISGIPTVCNQSNLLIKNKIVS